MAGESSALDFDDSDDDAFASVPAEMLQELEADAIRATQQPSFGLTATKPIKLEHSQRYSGFTSRPALTTIQNNAAHGSGHGPSRIQEELVNLDDYSQGPGANFYAPNKGPVPVAAIPHRGSQTKYGPGPRRAATYGGQVSVQDTQQASHRPSQTPRGPDINSLKATIQRLEREKQALKQANQEAESKAQAKSGEVSILRETLTKSRSEYEEKIELIKQAQVDAASRSIAEIQALQKEKAKAETDKRFLEHDLSIEIGKSKHGNKKQAQAAATRTRSDPVPRGPTVSRGSTSLKKGSFLSVGDGFEDEEILRQSPKKNRSFDNGVQQSPSLQRQFKATTPSHRAEKRRKREVSPVAQPELSFHGAGDSPDFAPFTPEQSFDLDLPLFALDSGVSEKLDFVEKMMAYQVSGTNHPLLDDLSKYSLPLDPKITFSSFVSHSVNTDNLDGENDPAMRFCHALCEAWSQCLTVRYYEPIDLLVEALNFALSFQSFAFLRRLLEKAILLVVQTVELIAQPTLDKSISPQEVKEKIPELDTDGCLRLAVNLATACSDVEEYTEKFWKTIGFKFVFLLLTAPQPLEHISSACELLIFSCTDTTFGPIYTSNDAQEVSNQDDVEYWIAERLTSLLSETPTHPETLPDAPFPLYQLLPFRLKVLDALAAMSSPPRGGVALAKHPTAIGRLFEFLHEHVELLSSYDPSIISSPHLIALTVACVNKVMLVIYQLLKFTRIFPAAGDGGELVDVREKLKAVRGGEFLHTISLARLVFGGQSEMPLDGLSNEELDLCAHVADAAHRLLDEFLSPDEGEMLMKMYSSGEQHSTVQHPSHAATKDAEGDGDVEMNEDDDDTGTKTEDDDEAME